MCRVYTHRRTLSRIVRSAGELGAERRYGASLISAPARATTAGGAA